MKYMLKYYMDIRNLTQNRQDFYTRDRDRDRDKDKDICDDNSCSCHSSLEWY